MDKIRSTKSNEIKDFLRKLILNSSTIEYSLDFTKWFYETFILLEFIQYMKIFLISVI